MSVASAINTNKYLFSGIVYGDSTEPSVGKKEIPQAKKQEKDEGTGFTVSPEIPENQVDPMKGFFFIKVTPKKEQQLKVKIRSTSKEPHTVTVRVKNAYTSQNGQIDYDGNNFKRDKTLNHSLEEMTTVSDKKVTVKNFETKEVTITLKPPANSFKGIKAAAICIMKSEEKGKKAGISSSFGYRVGLVVTEEENEDFDYSTAKSLNFLKVKPTVHQGKRVIQARLQNPEPKILDDFSVETKLREKGSAEVLRKRTTNDMRMAPNSQFDFATNWGLDPIQPGTYVLSVRATSKNESWKWEKEFTIGEEQAKKINEEASYTLTYPKWVPIVVILLGVVTLVVIGTLYVRRKRWETS